MSRTGKVIGRPFKPGEGGRPAGIPNKATREIKEAARQLVESPDYQTSLRLRLKRGTAPHMETLLHHYAYGKPKETLDINTPMRTLIIDVVTSDDLASRDDD